MRGNNRFCSCNVLYKFPFYYAIYLFSGAKLGKKEIERDLTQFKFCVILTVWNCLLVGNAEVMQRTVQRCCSERYRGNAAYGAEVLQRAVQKCCKVRYKVFTGYFLANGDRSAGNNTSFFKKITS